MDDAKTYVHPLHVFPALPLKADDLLPVMIDCRALIKTTHSGVLPAEFEEKKCTAASSAECSDDDDDEDYERIVSVLDTDQSSELSEVDLGALVVPKKKRKLEEYYDSDDSFIDNSLEFSGNLGLMKTTRPGFFINLGPVSTIPLDGVELIESDEEQEKKKVDKTASEATIENTVIPSVDDLGCAKIQ